MGPTLSRLSSRQPSMLARRLSRTSWPPPFARLAMCVPSLAPAVRPTCSRGRLGLVSPTLWACPLSGTLLRSRVRTTFSKCVKRSTRPLARIKLMVLAFCRRSLRFAPKDSRYARHLGFEEKAQQAVAPVRFGRRYSECPYHSRIYGFVMVRKWPATMEAWESMFTEYPKMVAEIFIALFVVDGQPQKHSKDRL